MKINRLTKVIAIVLVLAMLPFGLLACSKDSSKISERLVEMMVGDGKLNKKNEDSMEYVQNLDAEVTQLKTYFDAKTGNWKLEHMEPGSSYWGVFYENLYKMITAWATKKSEYYHNGKILKMVKAGLSYLYEDDQGVLGGFEYDNYNPDATERLDEAEYLVRTLLILRENGKLSKSKAQEYVISADNKIGAPFGTGVELARSAYVCIACAVILEDDTKLELAMGKLSGFAVNVTNGAGLYADGSFLTTDKVAASGSYGVVAFSDLVEIAYAVEGTAYDFNEALKVPDYFYNWAMNSIVPSLYNGRAFASTAASYVDEAEYTGGRAVSSLLALAEYFEEIDDEAKANELRAIVKGYASSAGADFNKYLTTFGATKLEDVCKDKKLSAKYVEGAFSFAQMDKLTVIGPKYSASLSMSSYRTAKYETRVNRFTEDENDEILMYFDPINYNNWYSGDGALFIYTSTYKPDSNYWKYFNGKRMPGTTVASLDRSIGESGNLTGNTSNAGSVTLGNFALSSMFSTANNSDYLSTITVKKSWFFFDNEIVALGAGLQSGEDKGGATDYRVETIIENIYYGSFNSISTSVNLDGDQKLSNNREDIAASDALFVLGYGGIYVPADKNDTLMYSLKKTEGGNFVEIWLDHSDDTLANPNVFSGKSYEYVIIPSASLGAPEFFDYVNATKNGTNPGYIVLSNTEQVQAVKDSSSGVVGYTFWEAASLNGISTDFACSVLVKETDTAIEISVADFTHTSSSVKGHIDIGVTGQFTASEGITLNGTVLEIDRTVAANGSTLTIVITK